MKQRLLLFLLIFVFGLSGYAQNQERIIEGRVIEKGGTESIPFAVLFCKKFAKGTNADEFGYFKMYLPNVHPDSSVVLTISATGYQPLTLSVAPNEARPFKVFLEQRLLKAVEIIHKAPGGVRSNQGSVSYMTAEQAKELPNLFGEPDILRMLQYKPGASNGGDASTGMYIRGGGPDQNLIMLDEAVIYNPSHLFGFFSVFNSDAIKDATMYKAGFPARYGGRLSSVIDIKSREGNKERFQPSMSIGTISTKLALEGPIKRYLGSYLITARRTYFDVFTRINNRMHDNDPKYEPIPDYYFYDINGSANISLSQYERMNFSFYYGNDIFELKKPGFSVRTRWGNYAVTARYNRYQGEGKSMNVSLLGSGYSYGINYTYDVFKVRVGSDVQDYTLKIDWIRDLKNDITLNYGISNTINQFNIGRGNSNESQADQNFSSGKVLTSGTIAGFVQSDWNVNSKLGINSGVRYSRYVRGNNWYGGLEPRLSARYNPKENIALKLSYARMYQYLHLVNSSGASLPTDLWYPSGAAIKPQISDQLSAGFQWEFADNNWLFSNEYYYKNQSRQVDFKDGTNLFSDNSLDTTFVFGRGWAYGSEFYLEKTKGRTRGWIGYTLSWTWRQFPDINFGQKFHPRYDRRHDISVVIIHKINERWSLSGTFVYGTGNSVSLPEGRFVFQDFTGTVRNPPGYFVVPEISRRNSYKMAPYHRADVSVTYKLNPKKGSGELNLSLYNVYSRRNPYFLYFETLYSGPNGTGNVTGFQAKQVSLLPIVPSLSYTRKF